MRFYFYVAILGVFSSIHSVQPPPFDDRYARAEYVSSFIKPGAIGAEIGVCAGVFAYHVLLPGNPEKLFLIDPWIYGLQKDSETVVTPEYQKQRDEQYYYVRDVFAPYKNVEVLRMKSEDAVDLFQDYYFDYVYIDGEHSYEAVMRDLTNYLPKVKIGGYLIGDDYGWTGVGKAVQDFIKNHQNQCSFLENPYAPKTGGQYAILRVRE